MNNQNKSNSKTKKILILSVAIISVLVIAFTIKLPDQSKIDNPKDSISITEAVIDSNIVIPVREITETAKFYPAKINGTKLEILAVKAPDGSIRTAFNTCQVCYSSGNGYYVQEGDVLVCQNCGNRFAMNDVEVTRGGCNPVPITSEYKTVEEDTITISKEFLAEATVIFKNWK
jgi:uncharacterized membrane protein